MFNFIEGKYKQQKISFVASMSAGLASAAIFHPIDRGLYLAMVKNRSFLNLSNFVSPLQGLAVNCTQKTIANGSYFFMQAELRVYFDKILPEDTPYRQSIKQLAIGFIAGSFSAIVNNPFTAIKYNMWGQDGAGYIQSARSMWALGGYRVFLRGASISVIRDALHGCIYELLRGMIFHAPFMQDLHKQTSIGYLISNIFAASVAMTLTSPVNYLRNKQYHRCPSKNDLDYSKELTKIWHKSHAVSAEKNSLERLSFFNNLFKSNWGVARGVAGIVVTQEITDRVISYYRSN